MAVGLLLAMLPAALPAAVDPARGWVSHPEATQEARPIVLHFRRTLTLGARPQTYPVRVTADNRFILFVNGMRVAAGPATGDIAHWREERIDLSRWLRKGVNVVAATVWNGVQPLKLPPDPTPKQIEAARGAQLFSGTAPLFQQSVATGFRLIGDGRAADISTDQPGWRVQRDPGHSFVNGYRQVRSWYYVAGNPETIDATSASFDWAGPDEKGAGWTDAVAAPAAARPLIENRLPAQLYRPAPAGWVVRSDLTAATAFPTRPVTVPANSTVTLLMQRDALITAYPQLDVSGGKGATIKLTWAEALYDERRRKADRNLIGDLMPVGISDSFFADGRARTFSTLWWRTWRYAEINVTTKDQPLTLKAVRVFETGYPFEQKGRFESDDAELTRIFDVGWRTARVDAHETYMDTAFWEQLQYAGDTRLQMLISYAVSGDPRLAEQAIDALADSDEDGGLMQSAYPSRGSAVIAPFALLWVGMLDDWRMHQPDPAPIVRHIARMRRILDWFEAWRQPSGLLGKNPQWNFIDWAGQQATDRDRFPSYGKTNESCLMSLSWLGALQQGARIEDAYGDAARASRDRDRAEALKKAITDRCWVAQRGLFADNPDGELFSQHANVLAVLYDVVSADQGRSILEKIVAPGKGIDAPAGITSVSYYFAWYLAQAHAHVGLSDRYIDLLQTWRDLLRLNYTTWPEERDTEKLSTRSDSHAWSAHPTSDLLGIVAGIGPGAAGYKRLRVAPALGRLKWVSATAATPSGTVSVSYRKSADRLEVTVTRPRDLPGEFVWRGRAYPLAKARTNLSVPLR